MDDPIRLPVTICWHCSVPLDAASDIEGREDAEPEQGSISLCLYCGAVAVFGDDLRLFPPSEQLLDELADSEEFRSAFVKFSWARQYVIARERLLPEGKDPGR
jgi:hypothetical protein